MRQYQPAWEQLKQYKFCEIVAHRKFHARILKAIKKEKDIDLGYKLECSELSPPKRAFISHTIEGTTIAFTLTLRPLITVDSV